MLLETMRCVMSRAHCVIIVEACALIHLKIDRSYAWCGRSVGKYCLMSQHHCSM
eukprot:COSAG01_NODE_17329_length_1159_cov_2.378302_1_plen_53_part_10